MFGALGNFATLLKQAREMGSKMEGVQAELRGRRVFGAAGGGAVEIEMNGLQECLGVRLDPQQLAARNGTQLEHLLTAAINDAVTKAKVLHAESLKSLTGGLDVPGLNEAMEKLSGGST